MCELGRVRSQGLDKMEPVDFIRPVKIWIWLYGGGLNTRIMVSSASYMEGGINTSIVTAVPLTLALKPHTSVSPYISLAPPNPLSLPETRVNAWESVHKPFKKNAWISFSLPSH